MAMRILLINDHISFGGGGDAVFRLEREGYESAGFDVHTYSQALAIPEEKSDRDTLQLEASSAALRKFGKFIVAPHVGRSLRRTLQEFKPDLVRVHLTSKYPTAVLPVLAGHRVIKTLHGPNLFCATSWGNLLRDSSKCDLGIGLKCWQRGCVPLGNALLYSQLYQRLRPTLKSVVSLYHCPSRHIQEKAEHLGFGPTFHMPLGIDRCLAKSEPATHAGSSTIIFVGALVEAKGVLLLPDMLQRVREQVPAVRLVVCGKGVEEQRLRKDFQARGLMENVEFKGLVNRQGIVGEYRNAHVLVVPSLWSEQFGLVGPEALACGIPCVASRIGGIPEWLADNEYGFLVPPRDSAALASRVTTLLKDRELRLRMGCAGRNYARRIHDPDLYQRRWIEIATSGSFDLSALMG